MRRILALSAVLGLSLFATGCLEITETFTVNPDGSGKVVLDHLSPADSPFQPNNQPKPTPEQTIKKALEDHVNKSKGIDAWSELSAEITKDGRVHIHAVGYFPDITKAHTMASGNSDNSSGTTWAKEGDGIRLTFHTKDRKEQAAPPEQLTDQQIEDKIKQERVQYQQMKPLAAAMLAQLKVSMTYNLPGNVTESNIFVAKGNTATLAVEGKQMLDAMDKVNADDKLMREKVKGGKAAEDKIMTEQIFGKPGEPFAKVAGPLKPQFDYQAEAGKAKAAEAELFKKLGISRNAQQPK